MAVSSVTEQAPLILVTGKSAHDFDDQKACGELTGVITKSFQDPDLEALPREVMGRK